MSPTRWTRSWSIRARTALVFALAAMALATGVVVFTNVMSLSGVGSDVTAAFRTTQDGLDVERVAPATPLTGADAERLARSSVIRLVAVQQWQWSAVGVAGAGILAGGIGWLVSRRMLAPIDRITATANRLSASNLHERIALDGPDDELRRLSRTIDDLLGRLESAFESQRRFVAQASHELRTPLAVQRAAVQIGLHDDVDAEDVRAVRAELLTQNRRTEHLVESLLVLAEADRGLGGSAVELDLAAIADDVVAATADTARRAGVVVTHEDRSAPLGPDGRPMRGEPMLGEPTLVRQLVRNLVDNAVEYNAPEGFVRIVTDRSGILVENSGPEVPADVAPQLVEPFRRCPGNARTADVATGNDPAGRHSGLGLSIIASIVRAHAWDLTITARPEGGLRVRVEVSPM